MQNGAMFVGYQKRDTLSENRKNCLALVNIKAKEQRRGLGRFSDSPEARTAQPLTRCRLSATPRPPRPRPRAVRPRTKYRFSASVEACSATTPSPLHRPTSLTKRHVQLTRPTTPATSAARQHSTTEWPMGRESHRRHAVRDRTYIF